MSPTNTPPNPTTPTQHTSTSKLLSKTSWKETFANGAILSLEIVEQAAKFAPVPYLSDAVGSALSIVRTIQDAHDNKGDFQLLAEDSTSIVVAIFNSYTKSENQKEWPGDHLRDVVIDIVNTLQEICAFVEERKDKNFFLRMINHESDAKDIKAYREKLNLAIRKFGVSSHLELHETLQQLKQMIADLSKKIEELKRDQQENQNMVRDPKKKTIHDETIDKEEAELKDTETRLNKLRKKEAEFLDEIRQRREREQTSPTIQVEEQDGDETEDVHPQRRSRSRRSPRSTPDGTLSAGLANLNISPAPPSYEASSASSHPHSPQSQSHSPHQFNQYGSPPIPPPQQSPFYPNPNGYPQGYYQPPYMPPYASSYGPPGGYVHPYAPSHLSVNSGNTSITNTINSNNNSNTVINEGRSRSKHRKSPS